MRTAGIFMVLGGIAIIVVYIVYKLLEAIVLIPSEVKIAVALIVVGGLLILASMIKERISDSKDESFKGVKS
jgi:predicted Abi (CAAX) family protease